MAMKKLFLTGIAALFLATGTAHATTVTMPDKLHGEWCHIAGGDEQNLHQQTFVRTASMDECQGGDGGITVDADGWGGEGSCSPEKVEQITENVFAIYAACDENENGHVTFELRGNTLIMTWLSES
jgi:hypothetical protein